MGEQALVVRIAGVSPPGTACGPYTGVHVGLQVRKTHEHVVPADRPVTWSTAVRVDPSDGPNWFGPAIHGPRGEKFLYLVWIGQLAGAPAAVFRRAKLQLDAVPADVLTAALASGALVATVPLTDAKGMPRCASVRPPLLSWAAGEP